LKRIALIVTILAAVTFSVAGQVRFNGLDLNASSELLFTATAEVPEYGAYRTLFLADLPGGTKSQLTLFPERISVLGGAGGIQIQNRFGLFRSTPVSTEAGSDETSRSSGAGGFEAVSVFPAFVNGEVIQSGKVIDIGSSPDGRFLTYLVPTSPALADLRMYDTRRREETTISTRVELVLNEAPLRWSGDSTFFAYSRNNELYYYSVQQYLDDRVLSERLRRIGQGNINSVVWNGDNTLFYVTGSLVHRILGVEFFTRSLYQDLLKIGKITGKLPYIFDPNFDRFYISPDGEKILLTKDGRNVNVLYMDSDDFSSTGGTISLPFLHLPRNTRVKEVLWSEGDMITIRTGSIQVGRRTSAVYRLNLSDPDQRSRFLRTEDEDAMGIALSPDGRRAMVWNSDSVMIKDYRTWEEMFRIEHPGVLHGLWYGDNRIVIAGEHIIERVDIRSREGAFTREVLALSQADAYGFNRDTGQVEIRTGEFSLRLGEDGWSRIETLEVVEPRVSSEAYRVYLENLSRGNYRNTVMVRNVDTFGTETLFPRPPQTFDPFPEQDEPIDMANFSHGSRIRRRELALVFNAIDSVKGLTEILNTLSEYDIRATFFINGDFIERHPGAVREIVDSGHEVGNLFFTYFDFAGGRFQITPDFIQQGLARNEDLFFEATGRELSLLWHAPYYFVSPTIISASQKMNYSYIGRDVDSMDWVALRDHTGISRLYKSTARIIEDVMREKKPGSIVSMTVGRPGDDRPDGGRNDYLFHRLDVLLNGLIERGYEVVPVSTLMDNAR
jgi:peptidoglycan/xylan/chitin deacetylase (PgdA/CDA1 family)